MMEKWRKGKGILAKDISVGKGTKIWNYCNLYKCLIGENCVIGSYVEIGKDVIISDNCKIECGAFIPEGVIIGNKVFIGPHVVFTNDLYPRADSESWKLSLTIVKGRTSIGANSTIRCGITIGANALIGCGSVVTKDVPDNEVWVGNPARFLRKNRS